MKRKLIAIGICMALVLCMLPATALAYTAPGGTVYNDHDYNALKTFLDATSADGITTNGVMACGADYSEDPATWDGVYWVDESGENRVSTVQWQDSYLNGSLDLSGCTSLETLDVRSFFGTTDNSIDSIDVSGCTSLRYVYCAGNSINELDLTGLAALETVDCSRCPSLTSLTLTGCSGLRILVCDDAPIGSLTLGSAFPNLEWVLCGNCGLSSLDFSENPGMTNIRCENNDLTSLNVTGLSNLEDLIIGGSPNLGTLDISDLTSLVQLSCWGCNLSSLEIASTSLEYLSCSENNLTELDVSGLTALTDLYCEENNLAELDVSDCAALWGFNCEGNQLTSLDLSHNTALSNLNCNDNAIASLDVSHNPGIEELDCRNNGLTSLDTTVCTGLEMLLCTGNPLASVDTVLEGESIALAANGSGYVGMVYDMWEKEYYIEATSVTDPFINWTDAADTEFSAIAHTDITGATAYELTANFLTLTSSDADGTIYTGGRITLTPSVAGGTWDFDTALLSRSGNQFTGLAAGVARVTYTLGAASVYFDVTITASGLPTTGQDGTLVFVFAGVGLLVLAAAAALKRRQAAR